MYGRVLVEVTVIAVLPVIVIVVRVVRVAGCMQPVVLRHSYELQEKSLSTISMCLRGETLVARAIR
jgi:hypothetical protein